ncbi:conserved hypothetical protein [Paraburkholderia tropica]|uniref:DUF6884 domain-containing protein n=1 Tax=Paraburkholderia tropica TaxID=92647 RepID=UPI001CB044F8|nr:DUF6884 domain-containing protein [Paraburkholderia tropica]CAG9235963.1 conserved hypothetical protein [Paraburkholderia tropica]
MTDIYLVSCVGEKHNRAMPAKDLYASDWFTKARQYVERREGVWYILSAKHGLIYPDQVVGPYEQTLNRMPIAERRIWAQRVRERLDVQLPADLNGGPGKGDRCVVLAGIRYREFLIDYLTGRFTVEIPMDGLAIGKQLQWLKNHR